MAIFIPNFNEMLYSPANVQALDGGLGYLQHGCRQHQHNLGSPFHTPTRRLVPLGFDTLATVPLFRNSDLQVSDTNEGFEAIVDLDGFDAKDIKIEAHPTTRVLMMEGKKEDKDEKGFVFAKSFMRSLRLPEGCKLNSLKSSMTPEGQLKISCEKSASADQTESVDKDEVMNVLVEALASPVNHEEVPVLQNQVVNNNQQEVSSSSKPMDAPNANTNLSQSNGFTTRLNMSSFKPEDIVISVSEDGLVTIVGKHHEELEDGGYTTSETRRNVKIDGTKFDIENVESNFEKDGTLVITAPAKDPKRSGSYQIPVKVNS